MIRRRVVVHGHVQGVFFRAWTMQQAQLLRLRGFVRNRRDGSVEALFAGPPDVVSGMIASCRRGPSSARVDAVGEEPANADALGLRRPGERFSVLPTI